MLEGLQEAVAASDGNQRLTDLLKEIGAAILGPDDPTAPVRDTPSEAVCTWRLAAAARLPNLVTAPGEGRQGLHFADDVSGHMDELADLLKELDRRANSTRVGVPSPIARTTNTTSAARRTPPRGVAASNCQENWPRSSSGDASTLGETVGRSWANQVGSETAGGGPLVDHLERTAARAATRTRCSTRLVEAADPTPSSVRRARSTAPASREAGQPSSSALRSDLKRVRDLKQAARSQETIVGRQVAARLEQPFNADREHPDQLLPSPSEA